MLYIMGCIPNIYIAVISVGREKGRLTTESAYDEDIVA